jgi:hypothetical protein
MDTQRHYIFSINTCTLQMGLMLIHPIYHKPRLHELRLSRAPPSFSVSSLNMASSHPNLPRKDRYAWTHTGASHVIDRITIS